jgi:hypothetical protein
LGQKLLLVDGVQKSTVGPLVYLLVINLPVVKSTLGGFRKVTLCMNAFHASIHLVIHVSCAHSGSYLLVPYETREVVVVSK